MRGRAAAPVERGADLKLLIFTVLRGTNGRAS